MYVTGYSYGNEIDYATIKYNSDGVQQWVARYNGSGNSQDAPTALAVDNSGNVFVTGWSRSTSLYGSEDYLTIKYNSHGVEQWVARYNGPSNLIDQAASMALDDAGNVHVTGYSLSASTQADYVTIKYDSSGVQQWLATYNNGSFDGSDIARMVIVDDAGNVYVTGTSGTEYPYGYPNYVTIKYNPSGVQQWVSAYNGPGNADDAPHAIALDQVGNVYVTGKTTVPGFFYDFATVKYSPSGVQLWEKRFNGASNMHDGATWVSVDDSGNVYVAGNSMYFTNYASDYVVVKYSQSSSFPTGIVQVSADIPDGFSLGQNYPNPFNPTTTFRFEIPQSGFVNLKVFDVLGREVATLVNEEKSPGIYAVLWDARQTAGGQAANVGSGTYFARLESNGKRQITKMLLTR